MVEQISVNLFVDDGSQKVRLRGDRILEPVIEHGKTIQFHLHRKQVRMGGVPVDQFWMDSRGLYGERNQKSVNREAIIDYFWALSCKHLTVLHRETQEVFVLAKLLPSVRSHGSQRVFVDATLSRKKSLGLDKATMSQELEMLLAGSSHERLTEIEFRDRTGDLLGPPSYSQEVWEYYRTLLADVLDEGCEALERSGQVGIEVALSAWSQRMSTIGRRAEHGLEKQAMDILSYEARAAFHQCYSALWHDLLEHLTATYHLSDESVRFHRLWHFDIRKQSEEFPSVDFHLFHGHIFALHPACGNFMLTATGPRLIGDCLSDPNLIVNFQRLLHGLYVAMHHYHNGYENSSQSRRKQPHSVGGAAEIEDEHARQSLPHRKSRRKPDSD